MIYRVLDLFSGIGGFSLGLERTGGFETVAFCEIDPFARKVLAKHWPNVPCYEDVRDLTADRLAADGIGVDVICGGFPCQDVSLAGERRGLEGNRSGLWSEIARLVGELRPRFLLVENVSGLLSLGMDRVLGDLAALGYDAEWECIPAAAVGAPHVRDRIWIVAHPERPGWKGFIQNAGLSLGKSEAHAEPRNEFALAWSALDDGLSDLREHDGLSVTLERRRLHALGNAVVPQIPEMIGRAILLVETQA